MKFDIGERVEILETGREHYGCIGIVSDSTSRYSTVEFSNGEYRIYDNDYLKPVGRCRIKENHTAPKVKFSQPLAEDGQVKSAVDSIPAQVLLDVGDVFAFGQKKYYADKWLKEPTTVRKRIASALRHVYKYQAGIAEDDESHLHHLDHAITQLMMAKEYINRGIGNE